MEKSIFSSKNNKNRLIQDIIRQLDLQRIQIALELENLRNLNKRLDDIVMRLTNIERLIEEKGISRVKQPTSVTNKTKELIKLILQKQGELTPIQLSKLIGLSRTRCNEYLKDMEREGIVTSRKIGRRKVYKLRQK
jgi:Fic family protein